MKSPTIIKRWISTILGCLIFLTIAAQDKAALERERSDIQEQIETAQRLLQQAKKKKNAQLQQVAAISAEIDLRSQLIANLESDISRTKGDMVQCEQNIEAINARRTKLLERQAEHMRKDYLNRRTTSSWYFLLSASSLNEVYARWRYLRVLGQERARIYGNLSADRDSIASNINQLEIHQNRQLALRSDATTQEQELIRAREQSRKVVGELRTRESELTEEITRKKAESERLTSEISKIISAGTAEDEIEASSLPSAPELAALSERFEDNKGKLPWPVSKGVITGKFGKQAHPVLSRITINNNGIDITVPPGERIKAVFEGVVVGRTNIPGFNNMIIVQHGKFYTVYSKLTKVRVDKGDRVRVGQVVGSIDADDEGQSVLHLEIWLNKKQLDPAQWIARSR